MSRTYSDHIPSLSRPFDQHTQTVQRNRMEYPQEINNSRPRHESYRTAPTSQLTPPRSIYHSSDARPLVLESPPVALSRRQPIPHRRSSYIQPHNHQHHNHHHHQRSEVMLESVPQHSPLFNGTAMTTHMNQRPSNSFLSDLLQ